jgi:hypothetical protein
MPHPTMYSFCTCQSRPSKPGFVEVTGAGAGAAYQPEQPDSLTERDTVVSRSTPPLYPNLILGLGVRPRPTGSGPRRTSPTSEAPRRPHSKHQGCCRPLGGHRKILGSRPLSASARRATARLLVFLPGLGSPFSCRPNETFYGDRFWPVPPPSVRHTCISTHSRNSSAHWEISPQPNFPV